MDIELPAIPAGILTLLSVFAPYVIAVINRPSWSPSAKKVVAVVAAIVLAAVVMLFYYVYTGDVIPSWPALILLAVVVVQASYALVTRDGGAKRLEDRTSSPGGSDGVA